MKNLLPPIDKIGFFRLFHLHCFIHLYQVYFAKNARDYFSQPRFKLFKPIKKLFQKKQDQHCLFKNILYSYQNQIILGTIVTLIFASCNLLVPQLIRSFLHFMHEHHVNKSQFASAESFIQKFFVIQFLRIIFGQHAKRLFYQLAIQIQSSLCKKIIMKSLSFDRECRDRTPKSQIIQLQNVDLKLIFLMFKNMYLIVQAPFTIFVAIILLFRQNHIYGFIGIYWFIIAFLLQRELDGKMRKCNKAKFQLIDERSKINYELFGKIKQAKMIHYEQMLIQKNNNLFIQQNHDHYKFYNYSTLYDITLLILPIIVVVTISLFDMDNQNHITVEQVYVMLQLLGICYNPMKSFRTITISFHDGFHSLKRLQKFFNLPDEIQSSLINADVPVGEVIIKQNTICSHPNLTCDFQLHITQHIQLKGENRLIVLGQTGQGKTAFLRMLLGQMKRISGMIFINGKKATSFQSHFFRSASILNNIVFQEQHDYNKQEHKQKVKLAQTLYKQLGLQLQFITKNGIHTIVDKKSLTKKQMKKISLARAFVSKADIYFLENPFEILDKTSSKMVEKRLRQLQKQRKTVIMTQVNLEYAQENDFVMILENGKSIQYGTFKDLVNSPRSLISKFYKIKKDKQALRQPNSARKVIDKFKNRVSSAISITHSEISNGSNEDDAKSTRSGEGPNSPYLKYHSRALSAISSKKSKRKANKLQEYENKFWQYFTCYMKSISFWEFSFVLLIIGVAQFLHIFIHYYIGHLDEDQQDNPYLEFQNILILQFILTIALAAIIYFEGQVSSLISIIQGNNLYYQSFKSIVKKPVNWFSHQFSVKLADKFNHDYEEIFIACHNILAIYKNIIILIITIYFVSVDFSKTIVTIICVSSLYIGIGLILRKVQRKVVIHYYDYKYQFVKIFQECLEGGNIIQIFNAEKDVFARTQKIYTHLASYKLAQSYTSYGQQIFCDFVSLILLSAAFYLGLQRKLDGDNYSIALIGTTIHLLVNVSQVLKSIVKLTINFQTFFNLNISPFLETVYQSQMKQKERNEYLQQMINQEQVLPKRKQTDIQYKIELKNFILADQEDYSNPQIHQMLNLVIHQQSYVSIYETSQLARAKLVQALTKNYSHFFQNDSFKYGRLTFGGIDITQIPDQKISDYVGVIMSTNFFFTGTLRQNIAWRQRKLDKQDEAKAIQIARKLTLDQDFQNFDELLLDSPVSFFQGQINSDFSKKIAVLRLFICKPKIIILKNTRSYIGQTSIVELIKNEWFCTILKITGMIQQVTQTARVIYMQNLKVIQDGKIEKFQNDKSTKLYQLLQQINIQSYKYQGQGMCSPRKFKKRSKIRSNDSEIEQSVQSPNLSEMSPY